MQFETKRAQSMYPSVFRSRWCFVIRPEHFFRLKTLTGACIHEGFRAEKMFFTARKSAKTLNIYQAVGRTSRRGWLGEEAMLYKAAEFLRR